MKIERGRVLFIISSVILALILISVAIYLIFVYLPQKQQKAEREQLAKEYYENKLTLYAEENKKYSPGEVDVVFLGDSLTDGYNLKEHYPEYLVLNRGIGGETTHGLEKRLKISVYDVKPKALVMLIGGNNLDTMLDNYENILIGFAENIPDTKVIMVSLTSMGQSWGHKNQIAAYNNVIIKGLAEKYGYAYVDLFSPLLDLNTGEIKAEYTTDGAHQTSLGYTVFTENIKPVIKEMLGR